MTEVKKSHKKYNFYFTIVSRIKSDSKLPGYKELGLKSKQALNYYIQDLKRSGFINKLGYGTWEVLKDFSILEFEEVKKNQPGTHKNNPHKLDKRGHAFIIKFKIPKIPNWKRRTEYLDKKGIKYKPLNLFGGGQQLIYKDKKVWLTSSSIVVFDKSSYFSDTAEHSKDRALIDHIGIIKHFEVLFNISLKINKSYVFKVSRQHFGKVKDILARYYISNKKRLLLKNDNGYWLLIDASFKFFENMDELETIHKKTGVQDMDEVISPFMNSLKESKGYTPGFVLHTLNDLIADRKYWAEHQKSHVASIQELATGVREQTKGIKKQTKGIRELIDTIKKFKKD